MCFKKIFGCNDPLPVKSTYVYLGLGINDYMGYQNDLAGCINDIKDEIKKLKSEFPEFQCLSYFDSKVTTQFFQSEIRRIFESSPDGFLYGRYSGHGTQIPSSSEPNGYNEALYLYNGPLIDDVIYQLQQETPPGWEVCFKFDSCFSGDIGSRNLNIGTKKKYRVRERFYQMPGVPHLIKPVNRLAKTDEGQRWVIMSGCGEEQTSADAYFGNRPNGAFTYFDLKNYGKGDLYTNELHDVKESLASYGFDQVPELSGPYEDKLVLTKND